MKTLLLIEFLLRTHQGREDYLNMAYFLTRQAMLEVNVRINPFVEDFFVEVLKEEKDILDKDKELIEAFFRLNQKVED